MPCGLGVGNFGEDSAVGLRVSHIAKMLGDGAQHDRLVISSQTGVRQNLAAVLKARRAGRRIIREINEWPLSVVWGEGKLKQWIEVHVLPKFFDGFICISDVLVDFCRKHGRKDVPIFKLPMTVDVESIDQIVKSTNPTIRQSDNFIVAYAGGMTEEKDGVESLRRAVQKLNDNLHSTPTPPSYTSISLDLIHDVSHAEAVRRLARADCLVLARPDSLQARAGFPTKLGDYLALGKPVVVTPVGEIPRYLADGKNALVGWDVAEKIKWVMEHPAEARQIGLEGRKVAERCFDWHVHASELNEWLKQF